MKAHPWFKGVDWEQMLEKKVTPPFVPCMEDIHEQVSYDVEREYRKEVSQLRS